MKRPNWFAARNVRSFYSFDVSGQRLHICDNRHLYEWMLGIICLKLICGFDWTGLIRSVKFDEDCSNLTRLNDFLEVQVAWRTSAWRREPREGGAGEGLIY